MLTLAFLGTGSAFSRRNFQSNALIEAWSTTPETQPVPDEVMLIDFGTTGPTALFQLIQKPDFGYLRRNGHADYGGIGKVFITHSHADHVGGLEEFAVMTRYASTEGVPADGTRRPTLIAAADVIDGLWSNTLSGGLSAMNGREATLTDYFNVSALASKDAGFDSFRLGKTYEIEIHQTDHVRIAKKYDWPSYGLQFRDERSGETVVFSGDTKFDPKSMASHWDHATTIFHDVLLDPHEGAVHAAMDELRTLPANVRAKTHLYHYGDTWDDPAFRFVADEFAGFAVPQQRYTLFR